MKFGVAVFLLLTTSHQAFGQAMEPPKKINYTSPTPAPITKSSGDTKSSNNMGQVVNLLGATANFNTSYEEAGKCAGHQYWACAMSAVHFGMGVLNVQQALAQNKTEGESYGSYGATSTGTDGNSTSSSGPDQPVGYDPSAVKKSEDMRKAQAYMDKMSGTELKPGQPFVYNPKTKTITTASGKTLKTSDLSSPESMAAAGIPKNVIDATVASEKAIAVDAMKKAEKYRVAGASSEEGGGGGGGWGKSGSGSSTGSDGLMGGLGGTAGLGIERVPTSLAGMQKNYNGEPIGVAGDSIFKMMTRRYKVKESQRSFYDESELMQK